MKSLEQIRRDYKIRSLIANGFPTRPWPTLSPLPEQPTLRDNLAMSASEEDVIRWSFGPITEQVEAIPGYPGHSRIVRKPTKFTPEQARYRFADAMLEARKG